MNDQEKANALRIAAYLENRLSPEEREAFKRVLGEDDELRRQYVDALMNRAGTGQNGSDAGGMVSEDAPVAETSGEGGHVDSGYPAAGMAIGDADNVVLERAANFGTNDGGRRDISHNEGFHVTEEAGPDWRDTPAGNGRDAVSEDTPGNAGPAGNDGGAGNAEQDGGRDPKDGAAADEGDTRGAWQSVGEQGAREAWEAGWQGGKRRSGSGFLGSGWMVGVVLLVLIIAGIVVYMWSRHHEFWEKTVASISADSADANKNNVDSAAARLAGSPAKATVKKTDSTAHTGVGATEGAADSLFAKLYKPYTRGDDPIAVRTYYQDYRTGNYAAVFAAGDSLVTGPTPAKYPTRNYIRLYKGLSYLATGKAPDATALLADVVLRTKPGDELYDAARWYLALAWLKRTDVDAAQAKDNALGLAREIARGFSRYRESARQMIKDLQ